MGGLCKALIRLVITVQDGKTLKQAIVVRTDLKMGKGKLAAQVAHASLSAADDAARRRPEWYSDWKEGGQATIVLRVGSEAELGELVKAAKSRGVPAYLVEDRGLTQLEPGTVTCLGIGPGPDEVIDGLTGALRLL